MNYLGIDYGRRKVGLAVSNGILAEPFQVIRYENIDKLRNILRKIIIEEKIEKVIVGVSEGKMGNESKIFSLDLANIINIPVEIFDETLSTHDAQELSIKSGMSRKKRKLNEDAFAATVMLQSYIDYV